MIEDILQVKELQVDYLEKPVLKNISFNAKVGEFIGIIGPNGAGKSTLMNVLTGQILMDKGQIYINGKLLEIVSLRDALNNNIVIVPQELNLIPEATVAENIFMGHEIIKHKMIQWKAMNEEANKLLKQLNADFDATAEMGTLSVAQQQMVEIAKALTTFFRNITQL